MKYHCRFTAWMLGFAALVPLCALGQPAPRESTNEYAYPPDQLVPLRLKLPPPAFWSGPVELPTGPHVEPLPVHEPLRPLVPIGATNLALHKKVTASAKKPVSGSLAMITDGEKDPLAENVVELSGGVQWVQIDLEQECRLYAIVLWHDFTKHVHVVRGVVVQAADDPDFTQEVHTLFNNDYENSTGCGVGTDQQYFDVYYGKRIDAKGLKARYLRFYSNGSLTQDGGNGYIEIEVWGLKANAPEGQASFTK